MLINDLSRSNFAGTLGRFVTLLTVCGALCVAAPIASAQSKNVRSTARAPKPIQKPLSKIYKGYRVTVNSAERSDSITDFVNKLEPPDESLEIVRINMTVKFLGKGDSIEFNGFDLTGGDGNRGIPIFGNGSPLGKVILYVSKDNPSLTKDIYFIIRRDIQLKTFQLDDLTFDITKLKVTKQTTFRLRGL